MCTQVCRAPRWWGALCIPASWVAMSKFSRGVLVQSLLLQVGSVAVVVVVGVKCCCCCCCCCCCKNKMLLLLLLLLL